MTRGEERMISRRGLSSIIVRGLVQVRVCIRQLRRSLLEFGLRRTMWSWRAGAEEDLGEDIEWEGLGGLSPAVLCPEFTFNISILHIRKGQREGE